MQIQKKSDLIVLRDKNYHRKLNDSTYLDTIPLLKGETKGDPWG